MLNRKKKVLIVDINDQDLSTAFRVVREKTTTMRTHYYVRYANVDHEVFPREKGEYYVLKCLEGDIER